MKKLLGLFMAIPLLAFGADSFNVLDSNVVTFTSVASPYGGAFLAAGDFTVAVSGQYVVCRYTNNEAVAVRMVADVVAMARF